MHNIYIYISIWWNLLLSEILIFCGANIDLHIDLNIDSEVSEELF